MVNLMAQSANFAAYFVVFIRASVKINTATPQDEHMLHLPVDGVSAESKNDLAIMQKWSTREMSVIIDIH